MSCSAVNMSLLTSRAPNREKNYVAAPLLSFRRSKDLFHDLRDLRHLFGDQIEAAATFQATLALLDKQPGDAKLGVVRRIDQHHVVSTGRQFLQCERRDRLEFPW